MLWSPHQPCSQGEGAAHEIMAALLTFRRLQALLYLSGQCNLKKNNDWKCAFLADGGWEGQQSPFPPAPSYLLEGILGIPGVGRRYSGYTPRDLLLLEITRQGAGRGALGSS